MEIPFAKSAGRFIRYGMMGRAEVMMSRVEIKTLQAKNDELQARNDALTDCFCKATEARTLRRSMSTSTNRLPYVSLDTTQNKGIMFLNAVHGHLAVRFHDAETMVEDIRA